MAHFVDSPELCRALEGRAEITKSRASFVEQDENGAWWSMIVNGPVLGPFRTRSEGIEAEVDFLNSRMRGN
jgi:hypothetical protein